MQSKAPLSMPRHDPAQYPAQYPAMIDRLRATLREVDDGLKSHPDYAVAREFRGILVRAIQELEAKEGTRRQLNSAA